MRKPTYRMAYGLIMRQRGVSTALHQLQKQEWLSRDKLQVYQRARLAQLLNHAYNHVPYYREVLADARVADPTGTVHLNKFDQIPQLDKTIIRSQFDRLKSSDLDARKWHYNVSGGSTGEPVRFIQDIDYAGKSKALKVLADLWTGYSMGDGQIRLWGSERDLLVGQETIRNRMGQWLRNEMWLNAFRMTSERMRAYVESINAFKPVQILTYAESIYELARFIERESLTVYPPLAIMTTADTLQPDARTTIQRVFKAPVFNRYGSREAGLIACECDHHNGLHVSAPTHYVEILRPDGSPTKPDEIGEIVVTVLFNHAMPIIRYRIGDMGAWASERCSCGRNWPLLREITGRLTDVFYKRDGGIMPPEYIFSIGRANLDWIKQFQVIQEDYEWLRFLIVLQPAFTDRASTVKTKVTALADKVREAMGQEFQVDFEFVDDILPTLSGKHRYTISRIQEKERREYQELSLEMLAQGQH